MTVTILFPRMAPQQARVFRAGYLSGGAQTARFNDDTFEETLHGARAFPATGGIRVRAQDLLELRAEILDAVRTAERATGASGATFDLEVGRILERAGRRSRSEFGAPGVWDFLALVLVPEASIQRLDIDEGGEGNTAAVKRLSGGDRRHVLQKLWKRWHVFGERLVVSQMLTEDEYLATLERQVTLQHPMLARATASAIIASKLTGTARRNFARAFMRVLQQASGLVQIRDDDSAHIDALVEYVNRQTLQILR